MDFLLKFIVAIIYKKSQLILMGHVTASV